MTELPFYEGAVITNSGERQYLILRVHANCAVDIMNISTHQIFYNWKCDTSWYTVGERGNACVELCDAEFFIKIK